MFICSVVHFLIEVVLTASLTAQEDQVISDTPVLHAYYDLQYNNLMCKHETILL
jgi:hypothetical protein